MVEGRLIKQSIVLLSVERGVKSVGNGTFCT
jgi:hypothetical protein